jgi:hypothetical protein
VVDYIKSIEFAGSFYSQIESALRRSQLIIFVVCGDHRLPDAAGGGLARDPVRVAPDSSRSGG